MKRNIFVLTLMFLLSFGTMRAAGNEDEKYSLQKVVTVETIIKKAAQIKSNEIDYAYISTAMFKQLFNMRDGALAISDNFMGAIRSIKSIRHFTTTGPTGYNLLLEYMHCFLRGNEEELGMTMMAYSRTEGVLSVIYSDAENLLVITEEGNEALTVVFIVGLTYNAFLESGMNFSF